MKNVFNSIQLFAPKRNQFDLSHDRKLSTDMGKLTPILCMEVLPSDKVTLQTTQMIRLAPLVSPMMHRVDVFTHFFFVPNRLLWDGWEQFITGGQDPDLTPPVFPTVTWQPNDVNNIGSLGDHLGLPVNTGDHALATETVNALPFIAANQIYEQFYRDQNLQPVPTPDRVLKAIDGDNTSMFAENDLWDIKYRNWEPDYFTASLPFAQKGDEATIPLGTRADLNYIPNQDQYVRKNGDNTTYVGTLEGSSTVSGKLQGDFGGAKTDVNLDVSSSLSVDLSEATASSINELRRAFKLQEWLEKNARGGTRYVESLLTHFGMKSSDARLQRPEYLGGGKSPVSVSEVLQTSESVTTPQGNLAGHGINVGQSHSFSRTFEEHGIIIGFMSVMPKPTYQQGLHRMWSKTDKFDYMWPTFANIGEQEVKLREIYGGASSLTGSTDSVGAETFGYVPRYSEYRYLPSTVHGDFRDTLSYWHMGRIFAGQPALNSNFITCDPTDRIFAVQDLPDGGDPDQPVKQWNKLYCHVLHNLKAYRPIPLWGTPSF